MKLLFITLLGVMSAFFTGCATTQNPSFQTFTTEEMRPYLHDPHAPLIRAEKVYRVCITNPNSEVAIVNFGDSTPHLLKPQSYREFKVLPGEYVGTITIGRAAKDGVIRPPMTKDIIYPTNSDLVFVTLPVFPKNR